MVLSTITPNDDNNTGKLSSNSFDNSEAIDIDWSLFPAPGSPEEEAMLREHEKRAKVAEAERNAQQMVTKAKLDAGILNFGTPSIDRLEELLIGLRDILKFGREQPYVERLLFDAYEKVKEFMPYAAFNRFVKSVKNDLFATRYKSELKNILQISDPITRDIRISEVAMHYGINTLRIEKNLKEMKRLTSTPEFKSQSLSDFFDETSEAIEWLIPELLPKGEMVLLISDPKCGKSLLAIDAAFSAATGEDKFLGYDLGKKPLKTLIISVDESARSTRLKMLKRGFRKSDSNVRVVCRWDISQLQRLEAELEDFRPDLVVVDSLKRINLGREISENSAEFADAIYQLKELFDRYSAASILIHHSSKNPGNLGTYKARGSSAIAGATWGQWQLERIPSEDKESKKFKFDPKDPRRKFSAFNRDSDGVELLIEFNPENNSWESKGEIGGDEGEQQQSQAWRDRILKIMEANAHRELSGREIIELLDALSEKSGVYAALSRMTSKKLISCHPAPGDKRFNVYRLPGFHPQKDCNETLKTQITPPSPPVCEPVADYSPESLITQGLEDSLQISLQLVCNSEENGSADYSESLPNKDSDILVCNFSEKIGGGDENQNENLQTDSFHPPEDRKAKLRAAVEFIKAKIKEAIANPLQAKAINREITEYALLFDSDCNRIKSKVVAELGEDWHRYLTCLG